MADKLGLGNGERQLKLGQSFTSPKSSAFHTVRYDFKPASVDINKMASVEVSSNNQVTVTVPHLDGAGVPQTVFKGSQRPYHKECVLIIDRVTGVITLEKLSSNIQVKKTRSEAIKPPLPQVVSSSSDRNTPNSSDRLSAGVLGGPNRPQTPPIGQRTSNKTRVTSGSRRPDRPITHLVPKHSPLHASPSYSSPGHYKSPKRDHLVNNSTNNDTHSQSTLASLPMIGMDDITEPPVPVVPHSSSSSIGATPLSSKRSPPVLPVQQQNQQNGRDLIGEISDTSSSSSDSDSGSDHETTASNVKGLKSGTSGGSGGGSSTGANASATATSRRNGHHANGLAFGSNSSPSLSMPAHILSEDLCLSESGSDSD
ncbi:ell-associated factor Eaf [Agrilus planipennis]|uniref:Ell-associated factor Eaf n=1 Tax=Agrilus planipennis TaxID=224129 RepID=A0A1W4WW10_AGRPL|nr:ell-associated factor Eaf [Agrilus planipennis]